jgi:predicted anti-sigma-YlaC factor YlaD
VNCREALELLDECAGDGTGARVGWRLKLHLWCCRNCRRYFSSYRQTLRLERAAFHIPAEDEPAVPEDLVAEIVAELRKPHSPSHEN